MIGEKTARNSGLLLVLALAAGGALWGLSWAGHERGAGEGDASAERAAEAESAPSAAAGTAAGGGERGDAGGRSAPRVAGNREAAEAGGERGAGDAERELFRLQKENVQLRARLDDMLNWILENVRGTYPLPEEQMANLRIRPLGEDGGVSADLESLLRLSAKETQRLEDAFGDTLEVLRELEAEGIQVTNPADYQVVLSIPPYAENGEIVREELYRELKGTLGAARFDRFLQVSGAELDEQFGHFGGEDRRVEFEAFEDEESGEEQLFVRDERAIPDAEEAGRVNVTSREWIVSRLPAEYEGYLAWLPDYVARFAEGPER